MAKRYLIPKDLRETIIRRAMSVAFDIYTDELDCSKSYCREKTDKTPDEVIELALNTRSQFTFYRREEGHIRPGPYFEVGCSTFGHGAPDYFLWLQLSIPDGNALIKEFDLLQD